MLKKSLLATLAAAVLGLSLAACSSDACGTCTKAPVYKRPGCSSTGTP